MDIKTLESLGISHEELGNRIVNQCVEALLQSYQNARTPGEAVRMVRDYHITPGTKYDRIEVHAA